MGTIKFNRFGNILTFLFCILCGSLISQTVYISYDDAGNRIVRQAFHSHTQNTSTLPGVNNYEGKSIRKGLSDIGQHIVDGVQNGINSTESALDLASNEIASINVTKGNSEESKFMVSPNPTNNIIMIKQKGGASEKLNNITLYNSTGQMIKQINEVMIPYEVNLENNKAGLYLLKISREDLQEIIKVVKK